MRIAIATAVYYPMINGVATFSHNLAVGLARRGHEVLVLTPSQTGRRYTRKVDGVMVKYLSSTTVKVYPDQIHAVPARRKVLGHEMPRMFYKHGFKVSVFPNWQIRKTLNDFKPDVLHVQVSDPIGLSAVAYARKHNIPVVTTEHNQPEVLTEPLHMPKIVRKPVNAMLSAYFLNRQSKSDYVTMPTELAIKELFGEKKLQIPVEAVSNGVDLKAFHPGKVSEQTYRKYDIPMGKPVVLYVGRVDPEKKVDRVVEMFKKLTARISAELVIVGDGVDKARLMAEAGRLGILGTTRFLGRVTGPDLGEIYRMGTVFVTGSEIETQGIVLVEAAASGLPLVAVQAGAVAEICHHGENGFLIKPDGDVVEKMTAATYRILTNAEERKNFSKQSVAIAHEHDFEKTLDKFIEIYQKVIGER